MYLFDDDDPIHDIIIYHNIPTCIINNLVTVKNLIMIVKSMQTQSFMAERTDCT